MIDVIYLKERPSIYFIFSYLYYQLLRLLSWSFGRQYKHFVNYIPVLLRNCLWSQRGKWGGSVIVYNLHQTTPRMPPLLTCQEILIEFYSHGFFARSVCMVKGTSMWLVNFIITAIWTIFFFSPPPSSPLLFTIKYCRIENQSIE